LLKNFLATTPRNTRTYLVNVRPEEAKEYSQHCKKTIRATLEQIKSVPKNSVVIIEDIISLSKKEELCLRALLNYYCHHKLLKLFAVTHTIHKNSIYSLLPLFHYLIFTGSAGNVPVARFVFSYFKVAMGQSQVWLSHFDVRSKSPLKYLVFDCSKMRFYECPDIHSRSSYRALAVESEKLQEKKNTDELAHEIEQRFKILLAGSNLPVHSSALISLLANFLPPQNVLLGDLSFGFKLRGASKGIKRIGLVDYVVCLLTPSKQPDCYQLALHNF
jgi:hypothetical protein